MLTLTLADVIEGLTGNRIDASQSISSVVIDSRQAQAGSLFVALPGQNSDGHQFVADAFANGAVAAIVHQPVLNVDESSRLVVGHANPDKVAEAAQNLPVCIQVGNSLQGLQQLAAFWRSKFNPRVIGVTGSVGKSTTKELLGNVLATRFVTLKNEGNLNNEIGLPLTLLKLNNSHQRVVLEMGMYALGEIALLCQLARPHLGVITNVGPVHLERMGTVERIAQAKSELVQALPEAARGGVAVLNADDPLVHPMAAQTSARVVTYGLSPQADLWASDVTSAGLEGIRFVFHYQGEAIHARLPLLGRHSVHTALRAALVGLVEGLAWGEIIAGLQSLPSTAQLRLVAVPGPNGSTLLDDTYNASPASTIAALNLLDDLTGSKKIAVLGDMMELGSFEEEGHRKVGCRAADVVDVLLAVGPRAKIIAQEARACGLDAGSVFELDNNRAAVKLLSDMLEPENVVLVKGSNSQRMNEIVSALSHKNRPLPPKQSEQA
ncbi:MAG: UDP-N-acetylmuramoyl-tripeptide--D-alanyl-D-alanine ligase [Chloroflexi bacterium]|nr:MAG: UDP-N-acetylmuramoyl-tripeptide--D-alanyl-D-alanine ligase [Chloroflexota bacterium]